MHLSVELRYPAPVHAVGAMLADEEFVRWRAARSGGEGAHVEQVDVTGGPDEGFTVTVRRTLPTDQIPAHVRSFVGGRLEIRQAEAWEPERDGGRSGRGGVELRGAAGRLRRPGERAADRGPTPAPAPTPGSPTPVRRRAPARGRARGRSRSRAHRCASRAP